MNLSQNQLSGPIPPEIGGLENLTHAIPPELENLTALDGLGLHHNQLSGPLPTWLGDMEDLYHLHATITGSPARCRPRLATWRG